ncbi:MAG TPA: peptide chain release factor N(5)-glutamine methyltransferase [Nitrospina sp.]|nr:peptide chain release factor N(5)-glutamine methyltransferase [Nitrospina sp.]|tara:strand:- start:3615 stop:4487 length:873 start_codon:yes stop_codon:yes gene_type:complete
MKAFLEWSIDRLTQAGVDSPRMEAEVLLAGALGFGREEIYRRPERILNEDEKSVSRDFVGRRVRREPVAHILGHREFWSLDFKITPDVLIPRPETETLIETLLKLQAKLNAEASTGQVRRLLDIGTGSGIIAVVAAREITDCRVTATDLSPDALVVARENADTHDVSDQINFIQGDLFAEVPETLYDFIVSNPPYIETKRLPDLMPDVRNFEPTAALDGGVDGLDFYRRIISKASDYLKEGGGLVFEIGETQAEAVSRLFCAEDKYETVNVTKDYSGYDRVVFARKRTNG